MAPTDPTILTLKQNFLTTQTRLLSQPLQPSRAWRRANEAAGGGGGGGGGDDDENNNNNNNNNNSSSSSSSSNNQRLTEKAVDDALFRLNHTLLQHARRVYAPQATRHVAEQIEGLYLAFGDRHGGGAQGGEPVDDEDAWRLVGADYANAAIISSLPPTWDSEREAAARPLEARRYSELVERLQGLSARREAAEARTRRLRRMKALLAPFDDAGADADGDEGEGAGGVQENLVTRDGEVERELERMRMLLARVGDKVARVRRDREGSGGDDEDDLFGEGGAMLVDEVEVVERRRVEALLNGFT